MLGYVGSAKLYMYLWHIYLLPIINTFEEWNWKYILHLKCCIYCISLISHFHNLVVPILGFNLEYASHYFVNNAMR